MSANFIQQNNLINISEYPNTFVRQGAFPLERFSVFDTLTAAENYAEEDPRAYIGQQLVVVESETSTPSSFVISGTGGALVRIPDIYDLTSASDNITSQLGSHIDSLATSDSYGHVKLATDDKPENYGSIAVNSDGQLVAVAATSSTLGVSKACSRVGQGIASSQHVIGIDANKCLVLNILKEHSGFEIVGEDTTIEGLKDQKTVLKVHTGEYPVVSSYHPEHDTETARVVTDNEGELAVYTASASWYGAVKIGTDLLSSEFTSSDYSRVPNCSSVKTAINTSIQGLSGTVDGKFLPLSGGTIKGSLFINYDNESVSHEEYWSYDTDDGRGMFICGSGNDSLAVRKKDLIAYSSELSSTINSKVYNEYLPLSGGTLSGNVYYGNDKEDYSERRPDLILIQGNSTNNKSRLIFKEGGWKDQVHLFATYADIGGADDNNKFHIATALGAQGNELTVTTTPKMTILFGSGNVGIGTQTPQAKLHVNGDIKSTSLSAVSGYIENKIDFPRSIVIGHEAQTTSIADANDVAIGQHASSMYGSVSIGQYAIAESNSVNIGGLHRNTKTTESSISIGANYDISDYSIGIGNGVESSNRSISIGYDSSATDSSVRVGVGLQTISDNAVAVGNSTNASLSSLSLGNNSGSFNESITIGTSSTSRDGSIIIGNTINNSNPGIIQIRAHNTNYNESEYGYSSLLIDYSGITITHSVSGNTGTLKADPQSVTIQANTLDKLNHIDAIVTSGSVNLIQSGAVYDFIHGDTVSIGSTTNTPSGTIEIVAIENELQNKLAVSSNGLTLAHPVSSSNENDEVVYSQDEVTLTADELKRIKNIENLKSTMVVREWDYTSTLPETTMTNNTMMIFRNWDLEQNNLDLIDEKLATV